MNVEIFSTRKDYVTRKTFFYLNVTEWLASPSGIKFSKLMKEMSKEN